MHFSIYIGAPKEKVWDTMLDRATYRQWTKAFNETSDYKGSWDKGAEIRFLGTDEQGRQGGMYSRIKENRLHEFLSIEHLGIINDGVVDTTSEQAKGWAPAFENYTFTEKDGGTELSVDVDTTDEFKAYFEETWPKALQMLKELTEK